MLALLSALHSLAFRDWRGQHTRLTSNGSGANKFVVDAPRQFRFTLWYWRKARWLRRQCVNIDAPRISEFLG